MTEPPPLPSTGMNEAVAVLRPLLREVGVTEGEIEAAAENGSLHMLALDRLLAIDPALYTLDETAEMSSLDATAIRSYWRALGFPDPRPGEKLFSQSDLDMLDGVLPFIEEGSLDHTLAVQMARVIGSSLARIATAQVEAIERAVADGVDAAATSADGEPGDEADEDLAGAAQRAAELLPMMPQLMEFVWRRHLGAAARRRIMRAVNEVETSGVCVGFAALVGFTAQTQQLPEGELAEVVDRFETIAYDVVGAHRGRVVKTLGDEVMFTCDDVKGGALIAIDLAARYREDEALSDVRVGLALGEVLERDGDVFGPVVNLAHRIVTVAYPASVVVAPEVRAALEDDEELAFKSIRSHYLKDIGRLPLWTLRRTDDAGSSAERYAHAKRRRAERRELFLDRRASRSETPGADGFRTEVEDPGEATTEEYEALADAVLGADISPELQVELLADIEASRRLHELEAEASLKADAADEEAERKLEEIEREARRQVEDAEREAHQKVEQALQQAEDKARRANEEASRKVKRAAKEAERKADRAAKDAVREAKRRRARQAKAQAGDAKADGTAGSGEAGAKKAKAKAKPKSKSKASKRSVPEDR